MKKLCIAITILTFAVSAFPQRTKTVTNQDLEKFRQQRLESERRLRERYAEMGFPAPEEIEREKEERRFEMEEYSDELRQRRLDTESEIRARANELRAEIAAIDGQINYLRNQDNSPRYKGGTLSAPAYVPFGSFGGYGGYRSGSSSFRQLRRLPPNAATVQGYALLYPSSQSIYRQSLGNVQTGKRFGGYGRRHGYGGGYYGGYVSPVIIGEAYGANDVLLEINSLQQQRAGLLAQWRLLEEEARRAGIRLN